MEEYDKFEIRKAVYKAVENILDKRHKKMMEKYSWDNVKWEWKPSRCIKCWGWIKGNPEKNKVNKYCKRCKYLKLKIQFIENKEGKLYRFKAHMRRIYLRIFKFKR